MDMDGRDRSKSKTLQPPTSEYLDLISNLASPKTFLFHPPRSTSRSHPTPAAQSTTVAPSTTMDKQQPSSFQQLEKVCFDSFPTID